MEIEAVMRDLANGINLDRVRAEGIREALSAHIAERIRRAPQLGKRTPPVRGLLPGSATVRPGEGKQPRHDPTDALSPIEAVVDAAGKPSTPRPKISSNLAKSDDVTQDPGERSLAAGGEHRALFRDLVKGHRSQ